MTSEHDMTVGPDAFKLFRVLALGTVGLTASVAGIVFALSLLLFGSDWFVTTGLVIVIVAGVLAGCVCTALFVAGATRRRPRVEIAGDGFVFRTPFSSRSRRWSDVVGDFVVLKNAGVRGVGYRLSPGFRASAGIKPTNLFDGNDEAISGAFALTVDELAALLNEHKRRAMETS